MVLNRARFHLCVSAIVQLKQTTKRVTALALDEQANVVVVNEGTAPLNHRAHSVL